MQAGRRDEHLHASGHSQQQQTTPLANARCPNALLPGSAGRGNFKSRRELIQLHASPHLPLEPRTPFASGRLHASAHYGAPLEPRTPFASVPPAATPAKAREEANPSESPLLNLTVELPSYLHLDPLHRAPARFDGALLGLE